MHYPLACPHCGSTDREVYPETAFFTAGAAWFCDCSTQIGLKAKMTYAQFADRLDILHSDARSYTPEIEQLRRKLKRVTIYSRKQRALLDTLRMLEDQRGLVCAEINRLGRAYGYYAYRYHQDRLGLRS